MIKQATFMTSQKVKSEILYKMQNALAVYSLCHSMVLNQRPHTSYPANDISFACNAIALPKTEPSEDLTSAEESSSITTSSPLTNDNSFAYNTIASPKTEPSEDLTSSEESSSITTSLPLDLLNDLTSTNNNSMLSVVTSSSKEYSQNVPGRIGIDEESISTTLVGQVKQEVPTQVTLVSPRTEHLKLLSNKGSSIQSDQGLSLPEKSNKEAVSRKESCSPTLSGSKYCIHRNKQLKLIFLPDIDDGVLDEEIWWHPQNSPLTRLNKQILHQARQWSGNVNQKIPVQQTPKKTFSKATSSPVHSDRTSLSRCNKLPEQCTNPRSAKLGRQSCKKNQETFDKDVGSIGSCLVDDTNGCVKGSYFLSRKRWSKSGGFYREFMLKNRLWARPATATHINTDVARRLYVAGYQLNSDYINQEMVSDSEFMLPHDS